MSDRPVLRYFGGKFLLAPWIIEHLPAHHVYVEPYGGAASVLMQKPRSHGEIYNDLNQEIVNVFRVLRDPDLAEQLASVIAYTPWARDEFDLSYEPCLDPIEQARRTIVRAFMGHGATGACRGGSTGFRAKCYTGNGTQSYEFHNYSETIKKFTERLRGVIIENRPALELFEVHDSEQTLWYVDPPYVHATRGRKNGYKHELGDEDHVELIRRLADLRGMVVLSGYENEIYDRLGWRTAVRETRTDGNEVRREMLWINDRAWAGLAQQRLL